VERDHELAVERLVQRVLGHEVAEQAHQLAMATQDQVALHEHLGALESQLRRPGGEPAHDLAVLQVGEHRPAVEPERGGERGRRLLVPAGPHAGAPVTHEPAQDERVQLVLRDVD
jgi:hypothetical protein